MTTPQAPRFAVGLDLALVSDFTGLVVLQRTSAAPASHPSWRAIHIERLPKGTGHPAICAHVGRVVAELGPAPQPHRPGRWELAVDATGVGGPIVADLRETIPNAVGVTITGGDVEVGSTDARVSKSVLIGGVQVALERRRLTINGGLPDADLLIGELLAYEAKETAAGAQTWNARQGENDDLVLATALALWLGNRRLRSRHRAWVYTPAKSGRVLPREWSPLDSAGWMRRPG